MPFQFRYASDIRTRFPWLGSGALLVRNIDAKADASTAISRLTAIADQRLAAANEGELPEIQAWRRAYSTMGLKPTQYRCASEALHETAEADVTDLMSVLGEALRTTWPGCTVSKVEPQ